MTSTMSVEALAERTAREPWFGVLIDRAREESHGLGLFIRSLVGLDRTAATAAFERYLSDWILRSMRAGVPLVGEPPFR